MGFIEEWQRWHDRRIAALAAPYGPLTSLCAKRLEMSAHHEDVFGLEWSRPTSSDYPPRTGPVGVHTAARTRFVGFRIQIPRHSLESELSGDQRSIIESEGMYALQALEEQLLETAFGGIEIYEPDKDWVLPGVYVEYGDPQSLTIPYTDGRPRELVVSGEIRFAVDGQELSLAVSLQPRGALHAIFSDTTRESKFPFRFAHITQPGEDGLAIIDFNRATVPLAAFSQYCPGPTPPPGNDLPIPIHAGESRPFLGHPGLVGWGPSD